MRFERPIYVCPVCNKNLSTPKSVDRHVQKFHSVTRESKRFTCSECNVVYTTKYSLTRHTESRHNSTFYECNVCNKKYIRKDALRDHLISRHLNENEREVMICNYCKKEFYVKDKIRRHISKSHLEEPKSFSLVKSYTCVLCHVIFRTRYEILSHYESDHKQTLVYESYSFKSEVDFMNWKKDVEHQYCCFFRRHGDRRGPTGKKHWFVCHRSGFYAPLEYRKRRMQKQGSKKINGLCPAEIVVSFLENGTCAVKFLKTHIGHSVDRKELVYVPFTVDERNLIAEKIASGIPSTIIVQQMKDIARQCTTPTKLSVLTRADVDNIAKSYNLTRTPLYPKGNRRHINQLNEVVVVESCVDEPTADDVDSYLNLASEVDDVSYDPAAVEAYVKDDIESVIYYKPKGKHDLSNEILEDEDFVIVIMRASQIEKCKQYAKNAILVDGTYGINRKSDFLLHKVMVIDAYQEGYPCCFMVTNRNDQTVVDIMFSCLREKVGEIATSVFMCDMQPMYYNSWTSVMKIEPKFHLYCAFLVIKAWKGDMCKLPKHKKNEVYETLMNLLYERDVRIFHEKLDVFLNKKDEELQKFNEYFERTYKSTIKNWAYCYRQHAGLNTNMALKTLNSSLKTCSVSGASFERVHDILLLIERYMKQKEVEDVIKNMPGGKLTYKIQLLRRAHDEAAIYPDCEIVEENFGPVWTVKSFTKDDTEYTVRKLSTTCTAECPMMCHECNFCTHQFNCSCLDNSIRNIMCKHIHALCMQYIQEIVTVTEDIFEEESAALLKNNYFKIENIEDIPMEDE